MKMSEKSEKGFDRIAFAYDFIANFFSFNQINKSQLAFLSQLSTQSSCLIMGGGTGYFLQKLVETNKTIHVTYIDASEKMIAATQQRIDKTMPEALNRVTFVCKNIEDFEWKQYDIIVCNYFLDLFDDEFVNVLIEKMNQNLNPGDTLYITDFTIQNKNNVIKWFTKMGLKFLYLFFRLTTSLSARRLPDIEKIVSAYNFNNSCSQIYLLGILKCTIYIRV